MTLPRDVLTTKQAAEYLGLSVQRILQLIRDGRLKAVKFSRVWTIEQKDLDTLVFRPQGWPKGKPRKKEETPQTSED